MIIRDAHTRAGKDSAWRKTCKHPNRLFGICRNCPRLREMLEKGRPAESDGTR